MTIRTGVCVTMVGAVLLSSLVGGCTGSSASGPRSAGGSRSSSEQTNQQQVADIALKTAKLRLPAGAKVVAADVENGIDQLFRVSLELPADAVDPMLREADFAALQPGVSTMAPLPGAPKPDPQATSAGQDRITGGSGGTWYREVQVDRSDPTLARVQLWVFTT